MQKFDWSLHITTAITTDMITMETVIVINIKYFVYDNGSIDMFYFWIQLLIFINI